MPLLYVYIIVSNIVRGQKRPRGLLAVEIYRPSARARVFFFRTYVLIRWRARLLLDNKPARVAFLCVALSAAVLACLS